MFALSLVLCAVLIAVDQVLKVVVDKNIQLGEVIEVIKLGSFKLFSLTHIRNSGAAWSIMSGKTWFLVSLPVIVCMLGIAYMYKIRNGSKLELISISMIISGGIGNLIDRIRMKEVIDYIMFEPYIFSRKFPIFNFADICIVIGAILFCLSMLISESKKTKAKKLDTSEAE